MSMLQVRWSLNAATPSKRKTLACDYNPIHKRLRDFGTEAQEVETLPNGAAVSKPQEKSMEKKASKPSSKKPAAPPSPDMMQNPVTLQSIVAELEGAGLLRNLEGQPSPASPSDGSKEADKKSSRHAKSSRASPQRELSLGAAGLLSAAGLLPEDEAAASSARSNSSDAGAEAPPSNSSDAGSSINEIEDDVAMGEGIDPLAFLQEADLADEPPIGDVSRTDSVSSLASLESAAPPAVEVQPSKPDSIAGDSTAPSPTMPSAAVSPAPEPPSPAAALPSSPVKSDAERLLLSDKAFEELANELEADHSQSLLSELNGLCDLPDGGALPTAAAAEDDLFGLSLETGDERNVLLQELDALPEGSPSLPMTFTGFDLATPGAKRPKSKGGKGKGKGGKGAEAEGEEAADVTPPTKRARKSPASKADARASSPPAPAGTPASAPATPFVNMAPAQMMLPPANGAHKFLPGAVQTPAPPPTKAALGGKPPATGPSMGRTFSWQPIKFPVYK